MGNAHLDYNPKRDFVKFAQANFIMEQMSNFLNRHQGNGDGEEDGIPFILAGDFNSLPDSSVLSAFYGENIEDEEVNSRWEVPLL